VTFQGQRLRWTKERMGEKKKGNLIRKRLHDWEGAEIAKWLACALREKASNFDFRWKKKIAMRPPQKGGLRKRTPGQSPNCPAKQIRTQDKWGEKSFHLRGTTEEKNDEYGKGRRKNGDVCKKLKKFKRQ